jgi:hypothetical protein
MLTVVCKGALAFARKRLGMVSVRGMAITKGHPKNPGEGGGFFGLNPVHRQTDAQKYGTQQALAVT